MALGNMLQNAASQALGNLEKAVIEIIDMRDRQIIIEPAVPAGGSAGRNISLTNMPSNVMNSLDTTATLAGAAAITDSVTDIAKMRNAVPGNRSAMRNLPGASRKLFYVQFNPNELSLSGYGGGLSAKTDFSKGGGISFESVKVRITMDVRLIFDKVEPQDAFMSDKQNTAPTQLMTGTVRAVQSARGKKNYSVQNEVEGFIAALRSPYTRRITFHWGDMTYTGILNRVSAQYMMFNVVGQPIRAAVNLSLVCADQEVAERSMGRWQIQYYKAFKGENQSYVKAAQKAGNLINYNL